MKKSAYALLYLFLSALLLSCSSSSSSPSGPNVHVALNLQYPGSFTFARIDDKNYSHTIGLSIQAHQLAFYNGSYYTAGSYYDGYNYKAALFKDSTLEELEVPEDTITSSAYSVAFNLGVSYVAGGYVSQASGTVPCLWVDGSLQPLENPLPKDYNGYAYSVAVSDNESVYTVGEYVSTQGLSRAVVWTNGVITELDTPVNAESVALSVDVSGDKVNIAGYIDNEAALWVDNVLHPLEKPANHATSATAVLVAHGSTYVTGYAYSTSSDIIPVLWVDGAIQYIEKSEEAVIPYSVAVLSGGTVYLAGSSATGKGFLWKDGVLEQTVDGDLLLALSSNNAYTGVYKSTESLPVVWNRGGVKLFPSVDKAAYIYDVVVSPLDGAVYTAGFAGDKAAIWRNNELQGLSSPDANLLSGVKAVAVSATGDVYGAGNALKSNYTYEPVLWINGTYTTLSSNFFVEDMALSANGEVYVAGYDNQDALLWHNGTVQTLNPLSGDQAAIANGVTVAGNGTAYVTGISIGSNGHTPVIWNNNNITALSRPDGALNCTPESVALSSDGDIYVAGSCEVNYTYRPSVWVNGTYTALEIPESAKNGFAESVTITGDGSVYVAGVYYDNGESKAALWENGGLHTLGSGTANAVVP